MYDDIENFFEQVDDQNYDAVEKLLKYGDVDVNSRDYNGYRALHYASEAGNEMLIKLLLRYGADVNAEDDEGDMAIYSAVLSDKANIVKLLLDNQAKANQNKSNSLTPLHTAIVLKNYAMVEFLLEAGALIDAEDEQGQTPLDIARAQGDRRLIRMLERQQAQNKLEAEINAKFTVEPLEEVEVTNNELNQNSYFVSSSGDKLGENAKFFVGLPECYEEAGVILDAYEEKYESQLHKLSDKEVQNCLSAATFLILSLYQLNEQSDQINDKFDQEKVTSIITALSPYKLISIYENYDVNGVHWLKSLSKQLKGVDTSAKAPSSLLYDQGNRRSEYIARLASTPVIPN
ncbi:ankyrin repeat domain-containing protein [Thiotrichales bacterium 19S3-7]|nr:ankyrin repeat domain-containing protein [Thiotrichales bacterium 19S3-7]MCF6802418.1 ankyrin repeat domain-containing protein [Thiotrichales bacterium 19S3-11]